MAPFSVIYFFERGLLMASFFFVKGEIEPPVPRLFFFQCVFFLRRIFLGSPSPSPPSPLISYSLKEGKTQLETGSTQSLNLPLCSNHNLIFSFLQNISKEVKRLKFKSIESRTFSQAMVWNQCNGQSITISRYNN